MDVVGGERTRSLPGDHEPLVTLRPLPQQLPNRSSWPDELGAAVDVGDELAIGDAERVIDSGDQVLRRDGRGVSRQADLLRLLHQFHSQSQRRDDRVKLR